MNSMRFKFLFSENKEIIIFLLVFIFLYTFNLDKFPRVWTDEAWFSNPAYALITIGKLGTTMKYDFFNIANYTYWQPPVFLLLLAVSFKLFGFGIIQARIVSVLLGLITVLFTYLLGKKLYNTNVGLLASLLLISNPLFFYVSRQSRMDIAVVCFLLIAFYYIFKALKQSRPFYYFLSAFMAMLATLSHPNGLIGFITIFFIIVANKIKFKHFNFNNLLKNSLFFILGVIIPLIPYLFYLSLDFDSFKGQFMNNIGHSPANPFSNLIGEPLRYLSLILFFEWAGGFLTYWIIISIVILTIWGVLYVYKKRNFSENFLIIIILSQIISITLLVASKMNYWYLAIILPYWSILVVLPFKNMINLQINKMNLKSNIFTILLVFLIIINFFTIFNIFHISSDYNYRQIEYEVQKHIPKGSVIVGEPGYWIVLQHNYIFYDHYGSNITAFNEWDVDYILYDHYWENYDVKNENEILIKKFLDENCTQIAVIPNSKNILSHLGPIKVYKVNKQL